MLWLLFVGERSQDETLLCWCRSVRSSVCVCVCVRGSGGIQGLTSLVNC